MTGTLFSIVYPHNVSLEIRRDSDTDRRSYKQSTSLHLSRDSQCTDRSLWTLERQVIKKERKKKKRKRKGWDAFATDNIFRVCLYFESIL